MPRPDSPQMSAESHAPADPIHVDLSLEIPSDVSYIEQIVALVAQQCEQLGFPARKVKLNVPVALTEALSNAILRGNAERPEVPVRVRVHVDHQRLVVEVHDEGKGFDLEECTHTPSEDDFLEREDGRGLFLMRKLMDRVERYDDHGNVVRLTLERA